jgi:hypothetical protein
MIVETITILGSLSFELQSIPLEISVSPGNYTYLIIENQKYQNFETTLDYNYITTEKYIQENLLKYQDILP